LILIKITKTVKTGELKHALKRSKTVEQFEKKGPRRRQSHKVSATEIQFCCHNNSIDRCDHPERSFLSGIDAIFAGKSFVHPV